MKPKNKYQEKIVKLSQSLPDPSNIPMLWAEKACFDSYFVHSQKSNYCLECGHKWKASVSFVDQIAPQDCPSCGNKNLKRYDAWHVEAVHYDYWSILTTHKGYQVNRLYRTEKIMKKNKPAHYFHLECMQHWVSTTGEVTTLSRLASGQGRYYDSWIVTSKLEIRSKTHSSMMRASLSPSLIYPRQYILPIIKRNGFTSDCYGESPHLIFEAILSYPKAETLLKTNQIELFKTCLGRNVFKTNHIERIDKYWSSICIAMRNNYIVQVASEWYDYLFMLSEFNKDLNNKYYVCPKDLNREHDKYTQKLNQIRAKEKVEKMRSEADILNIDYVKSKEQFFDLCFMQGDLEIVPLRSVHEFIQEGTELNHCLFVGKYFERKNSLILSAKIKNRCVETIEVDLINLKINQARGLNNTLTKYHNEVLQLVKDNIHHIGNCLKQTGT